MGTNTTNPNNPPVASEPVLQEGANSFSTGWYQWFTSKVAKILNAPVSSAAPATSASTGTPGQIAFDNNSLYVCVGVNAWKKLPLSTF